MKKAVPPAENPNACRAAGLFPGPGRACPVVFLNLRRPRKNPRFKAGGWTLDLMIEWDETKSDLFADLLIAIAAIYRPVLGGFKGNLRFAAAFGADDREHFPFAASVSLAFSGQTALRAAGRIVLETFFRIKLLFGGGKYKFAATFLAS